jgi:transposase
MRRFSSDEREEFENIALVHTDALMGTALPAHLPREVVTHHPEQDCCPDCGEALRNFGEDVAEILEYIPANFKVIRHVRPKFACTGCERVVQAPAPPRTIERGRLRPGNKQRETPDLQA